MTDIKRFGDSGIHTVEGNVAGERAARLTQEREAQQREYEKIKRKIKDQNASNVKNIGEKFNSGSDALEQEFRDRTVGLVSAEDFRKAREVVDNAKLETMQNEEEVAALKQELKMKKKAEKRRRMMSALSFDADPADEEGGMDDVALVRVPKRVTKNPDVDTSHLPDRERDEKLQRERERLKAEWMQQQEIIKQEMMEVVYSFWDGSGHRKVIEVKKGCTVGKFLEYAKLQLSPDFPEIRGISSDSLMYVKEDLIIPLHISFYDLIVTQARGKSGPLFHFDVHDDVRLVNDARIEKDESHPGKVVERRWYERNKHIFPASRWEIYDPNVQRSKAYTIHGDEVEK